ncbi:MAG: type II toxin-antitoxin system RatA family toxin [Alphaproteobacteria bacterium]
MPTYAEKRRLPYRADQLFDLVADIERYPEFLPWCRAARVRKREGNVVIADVVIGWRVIRERFTSRDVLQRPDRIDVTYQEGPFKYLNNHWIFEAQADGSCIVDFYVDFEFHSRFLQKAMSLLFNEAVRRMVHAFEARAQVLYGAGRAKV